MYFKDWRCAEAKAKLYVDLINMPSCLRDIMSVHPLYYEYSKYCNALTLLGGGLLTLLGLLAVYL